MKWSFLIGHLAYHLAQAVLKIRDHDAAGKERRDDVTIAKERLFRSPGMASQSSGTTPVWPIRHRGPHLPARSWGLR